MTTKRPRETGLLGLLRKVVYGEGNHTAISLLTKDEEQKFSQAYSTYVDDDLGFFRELETNPTLARKLVYMTIACHETAPIEDDTDETILAKRICTDSLRTTLKDVVENTRQFRVRFGKDGEETCAVVFESSKSDVITWLADPFTRETRKGFNEIAQDVVGTNKPIKLNAERAFVTGALRGYVRGSPC